MEKLFRGWIHFLGVGGGRGWKPLFQDLSFLSARPGKIIIIKKKKVRFFFVTYVTPSPCNTKSSPGDHHTQRRWTDDPRPSIRSCAIFCARCGWCLCYSPDRWPDKKGNKRTLSSAYLKLSTSVEWGHFSPVSSARFSPWQGSICWLNVKYHERMWLTQYWVLTTKLSLDMNRKTLFVLQILVVISWTNQIDFNFKMSLAMCWHFTWLRRLESRGNWKKKREKNCNQD